MATRLPYLLSACAALFASTAFARANFAPPPSRRS